MISFSGVLPLARSFARLLLPPFLALTHTHISFGEFEQVRNDTKCKKDNNEASTKPGSQRMYVCVCLCEMCESVGERTFIQRFIRQAGIAPKENNNKPQLRKLGENLRVGLSKREAMSETERVQDCKCECECKGKCECECECEQCIQRLHNWPKKAPTHGEMAATPQAGHGQRCLECRNILRM